VAGTLINLGAQYEVGTISKKTIVQKNVNMSAIKTEHSKRFF
jgi:hypothetical protein